MTEDDRRFRRYGVQGPWLALMHGGPGAPGDLAPVGRELSGEMRVIELLERRSSSQPLGVARHVEDFDQILKREASDERVALLGFSSGSVLALAYATAHPERTASIVLVGSATMTAEARVEFRRRLQSRLDDDYNRRVEEIQKIQDADERLAQRARALDRFYSVDAMPADAADALACDARGHDETWNDILRLQREGKHPAAFGEIQAPVLMLHGADDPHPGRSIFASLTPHLPQLEYIELPNCGHYPWLERAAREPFFEELRAWLQRAAAN